MSQTNKLSVSAFRKMKREGRKIVMLTAYDSRTAELAAECGVDMLLVGDSLGMCVMGYPSTVKVTMDMCIHHCQAVRNGAPNAFIVGDMPFMSMHVSPEDTLRNAARFIQEGACDAVKVEADSRLASTVERMVHAGIPVMGHVGLLPQHVMTAGGYRISGKTEESADRVMADAKAMEQAGCFSIVLECVQAAAAKKVSEALTIPTIGIGAGIGCDGQVQVVYDTLGLFSGPQPKHAKRYCDLSAEIRKALTAYVDDVRNGVFPGEENSF